METIFNDHSRQNEVNLDTEGYVCTVYSSYCTKEQENEI